MTDFDYEVLQKKRLARQAKYKKSIAPRSRKCVMPTDYMTEKQWRERNGKAVTLQLNSPLSWEAFKVLPSTLQQEYINHLVKNFNANATRLSEMFCISPSTLKTHFRKNGIETAFGPGHSMTREQRTRWSDFIKNESTVQSPEQNEEVCESAEFSQSSFRMSGASLVFEGKIDIHMIANSLLQILGSDASGEVRVICKIDRNVH